MNNRNNMLADWRFWLIAIIFATFVIAGTRATVQEEQVRRAAVTPCR